MLKVPENRQSFYKSIAWIVSLYILYTLAGNYLIDPGAEAFLSHKTDLERELKPRIWLTVMYVHVAFACAAMAAGLVNFSNWSRKRRGFHRLNGYCYVAAVLIVVLTSGYMAPYATGGKLGSIGFNLLNMIWLVFTSIAVIHALGRRVVQHRRWMVRSYAFCFTNLLIHLLTYISHDLIGIDYAAGYTIGLYGSIALLLLVPESILRIGKPRRAAPPS